MSVGKFSDAHFIAGRCAGSSQVRQLRTDVQVWGEAASNSVRENRLKRKKSSILSESVGSLCGNV
jgi:hypothetical protein